MMDRRGLIMGGAALALMPRLAGAVQLPVPASGRIAFDVLRKGSKLGTHTLAFATNGADLTVTIAVELIYKLGPITLYHYQHHNQEHWRGDRVVGFETRTNDNGKSFQVSARRDAGGGMAIESSALPHYVAPADALPATHWNVAEMHGVWINPQDGKLLHPRIVPVGIEPVATAMGAMRAMRYTLTGDAEFDIWYDPRAGWVGLAFTKGGSVIRYVRQS